MKFIPFKMLTYADKAIEAENKYCRSLVCFDDKAEKELEEDIKNIKEEKKFLENLKIEYWKHPVGYPITDTDEVTMSLLTDKNKNKFYFLNEYNGDLAWLNTQEMMQVFKDISQKNEPKYFSNIEELLEKAKGLSDFKIVKRLIANYSDTFLDGGDRNYGIPEAYNILNIIKDVNPERYTNLSKSQIYQSYEIYVGE